MIKKKDDRFIPLLLALCLCGFQISAVLAQKSDTSQATQIPQRAATKWTPPEFNERQKARNQLVKSITADRRYDPDVVKAMRRVPRHLFIPPERRNAAYKNIALPIGYGQTISQPTVVAFMTDMLNLSPGEKVLEIGTGSGYQAAVLSHITSEIYTIEIIEELASRASSRFKQLEYDIIHTKTGDGYYGWKMHAPFDAIIVTAAAGHIPPPLIKQLKPGGIMAIPLGNPYEIQTLVKVKKNKSGELHTERLMPVRFVPMTGTVQKK